MRRFKYLDQVLLFAAGLLSVFAYAPFNRGIFIILSLLPLLWFCDKWLHGKSLKTIAMAGFCYGFGFYLSQLYWIFYSLYFVIGTQLWVAIIAQIAFSGTMALFISLAVVLYKYLHGSAPEFNNLFLMPSCWVLAEWLRGWILTGFPWSDLAYTQVNNYLMRGVFPLAGSYAVSWLALSVCGFLYLLIARHKDLMASRPQIGRGQRLAILYFMALALAGYYVHDLVFTQPYGKPTKVALIQANIDQAAKWDSSKFLQNLTMYADTIARTHADIIFLPETAFPVFAYNLPKNYESDITAFALQNHSQLVVGMPQILNHAGDYASAAVVLTESGHPYYAKHHLVPFGEFIPFKSLWAGLYNIFNLPMVGFSGGAAYQAPLVLANQKIALNICYENGFAAELLAAAREATLMANISDMVWFGDTVAKDQHLQLSQARALENQRYFIQETNTGASAIVDPWGQIQSQLPSFTHQVLSNYVQGRIGVTPYQKYGNYPLIILIALILCLAGCRRLWCKVNLKA